MGLEDRWPLPSEAQVCAAVLRAYDHPTRGYHDRRHLTEVLDRLDELAAHGVAYDPLPVRLAAWFHDAVHQGRPDDEERSAQWARAALATSPVPATVVEEVVRLVLLTRRHDPAPEDQDGVALCDADLGVLAGDPQRYAAYVAGVRREYAHVGDEDFRAGRAEVLSALAGRAHVFGSAHARAQWEQPARRNLARELAELTG